MRPSNRLNETVRVLLLTGAAVCQAAKASGAEVDSIGAAYALEALEACHNWRRDTTEASRRVAYANAHTVGALAVLPGSAATPARRALHALSIALKNALEANIEGACDYAKRAERLAAQAIKGAA